MRVGDMATGRAGDKGNMLDLTLVAKDDAAYAVFPGTHRLAIKDGGVVDIYDTGGSTLIFNNAVNLI